MLTTLIVQPIFNLLVLVYALLPGHNFGLALIIFTVIVRMLLWPLVKKQLHQAKVMRDLQPQLKDIKKTAKGDRQKESRLLMELYKERGINPFATFPILIVQLVILIGLYSGLRRVTNNPHSLVTFAYPALQHLSWMRQLGHNIHLFDNTLFGHINLSRAAINKGGKSGGVYWPAMAIVFGSAIAQYYQAKQLMPQTQEQRGLRAILKEAGEGKQADQSEVNAAVGRSTRYFLPVAIFLFTVSYPSALSLYWLVGGLVAFLQQSYVLRQDEIEMETLADTPSKNVKAIPEAEVVEKPSKKAAPNSKKASRRRKKK